MLLHKLPPFQNVGASSTAVMPFLSTAGTIVGIILKRGGTTFTTAHITNIRLRLDGKQFVDITGSHLENINSAEKYGISTATYNYIPFGDLRAATQRGQLLGAIDTTINGMKPMEMEVDIGGATAPTLEAWVVLAPAKAMDDPNKATIRSYLKATHNIGAAGEFEQPLPLGSRMGAQIHRIYSFGSTITKLQVAKDGLWLQQEGETGLVDFMHLLNPNRAAVSNMVTYDPAFTDNQSDAVSTLRSDGTVASFAWKFTVSGSGNITTYSSLYTTIRNV